MPKISVIIPMYNAESTIVRALQSILIQSYKDYEVIIVDDGSEDRSVERAQTFISDRAVTSTWQVVSQDNGGPSVARNHGMDIAIGEYIALLDADDEWLPDKLAIQISCLESEPSLWLIGTSEKTTDTYRPISFKKLLFKNYFRTSSVIFRNAGYRFNERQKYSEDYRLWLEIAYDHPCGLHRGPVMIYDGGMKQSRRSGLSTHKREMEYGELSNYCHLWRVGKLSRWEYWLCSTISVLKFIVRWIR